MNCLSYVSPDLSIPQNLPPARAASSAGVLRQPPTVMVKSGGFALLLGLTRLAAFFYLSGAANAARHDSLYAVLLAVVWGFYFLYPMLLRIRLGPLLVVAGQFILLAWLVGFFGGIYWLILRNG